MSETVKLIIEIPKAMYESVQKKTYCGSVYPYLEKAIPLDNVKAEIREKSFDHYFECGEYIGEDCRKERIIYLNQVLDVLDNIGKGESEDKEC